MSSSSKHIEISGLPLPVNFSNLLKLHGFIKSEGWSNMECNVPSKDKFFPTGKFDLEIGQTEISQRLLGRHRLLNAKYLSGLAMA